MEPVNKCRSCAEKAEGHIVFVALAGKVCFIIVPIFKKNVTGGIEPGPHTRTLVQRGVVRGEITGEKRFEELLKRTDVMEQRILDIIAKSARNPVEGAELTALVGAIDKRLDVVQAQIADINRQIAAAILLGGDDKKKARVPP